MRLTAEQVKQGLQHEDVEVRQQCLNYFTGMFSRDESVLPIVLKMLDDRGPEAFDHFEDIDMLAPSDASIEWAVRNLQQGSRFPDDEDHEVFVSEASARILLNAPGDILRRHRDQILSVLTDDDHEAVLRRLEYLDRSTDELWKLFEEQCNKQREDDDEDEDEFPFTMFESLIQTLAESGEVPTDRLMQLLLSTDSDDEVPDSDWAKLYLIKLAGLIRYEPALEQLTKWLGANEDRICIEARIALVRLGTDEVVRAIARTLPNEEWSWQAEASFALEDIHSEEAIRVATELLKDDSIAEDVRQIIGHGLACKFSTESLETLTQYLNSHTDWTSDFEWIDTFSAMRAVSKLLKVELPDIDEWGMRLNTAFQNLRNPSSGTWAPKRPRLGPDEFDPDGGDWEVDEFEDDIEPYDPKAATIVHEAPRVGRNDPCPCGSGKKFKKCCIGKM